MKKWYVADGTLEYRRSGDRITEHFSERSRKGDKNVTARNQVSRRFMELFPDVEKKRHKERDGSDRRNQTYLLGLEIVGADDGQAETTEYVGGAHGADDLAILGRLISRLNNYSQTERLTAITLMENFIESQGDLGNSSAPHAPADDVKVSARPSDAPENLERSLERSPTTVTATNSENSVDHGVKSTNSQLPFNITSNITVEVTNDSDVINNEHPPIEWVRDKAGISWNIDSQNGDTLIGHRPGLRGSQEIKIDDCADIHYKKKTEEMEA